MEDFECIQIYQNMIPGNLKKNIQHKLKMVICTKNFEK